MNTRRTTTRKVGEETANVGSTPQGNRNASQVKAAAHEQVSVNPLAMTNDEVRDTCFK